MIRTRHPTTLLLLCTLAGPCLIPVGGVSAQDRGGVRAFPLRAAIEEALGSPFHASHGPGVSAVVRDKVSTELRRPGSRSTIQVTDPVESGVSGANIFFFGLPVAAALDLLALSDVDDDGFGLDPLTSLGAIAAPALVAKLTGARTVYALVGSALGFSSGAVFAKAFDKFGVFLAPVFHVGAVSVLSIVGDRAKGRRR